MRIMKKNKSFLIVIFIFTQFFFSINVFGEVLKIGKESAKITVKVFFFFSWPHCASFHQNIFRILEEY